MKLTQPVLIQSYVDEFELHGYEYETIGETGKVLSKVEERQGVTNAKQTKFRPRVGKLLHIWWDEDRIDWKIGTQ